MLNFVLMRSAFCRGVWQRNPCVCEAKWYVVSSPDIVFLSGLKSRNTVSRETSLAVAGLHSASVISNILLDFWKVIKRSFAKLLIRKVFCTLHDSTPLIARFILLILCVLLEKLRCGESITCETRHLYQLYLFKLNKYIGFNYCLQIECIPYQEQRILSGALKMFWKEKWGMHHVVTSDHACNLLLLM